MNYVKPLNVFLYIKNNIKKFIPQIIAVMLGVFLVYFVCVVGGGIKYGITDNSELPYKKLSIVYLNRNIGDKDRYYRELKADPNVDNVIRCYYVNQILSQILVSDTSSLVFNTLPDDTKYLMKTLNFRLVQGRIPIRNNELLINSDYARNKKLKLGDYWGSDVNSKSDLNGKFEVVGIYDGRIIAAFAYIGNMSDLNRYDSSMIVVPKEGKLHQVNKRLLSYESKHIGVSVLENTEGYFNSLINMFNLFAVIFLLLAVFILTFTIGNVNYMHLYERCEEFALLKAIGYQRSRIATKLIKELMLAIGIGFGIGIVLGIFSGFAFDTLYCKPKGLPLYMATNWYVLLSAIVPVLVMLFSIMPIVKFVNNMNTVDTLEGRF